MTRKILSLLLAVCMICSMMPMSVFAEQPTPACTHQHDESCGYVEAAEEVECNKACTPVEEGGEVIHADDCAYTPAVESAPCGHVCGESCGVTEDEQDEPEQDEPEQDEPEQEQPEQEQEEAETETCECEAKCSEENINTDCAVCGAESADLSACIGKNPVEQLSEDPSNESGNIHWAIVDANGKVTLYLGNTAHELAEGESILENAGVPLVGTTDMDYENANENPYGGMATKEVVIESPITPGNGKCLFINLPYCTSFRGFENLNTANVTSLAHMFDYCMSVETLDLSALDTSSVTDISDMFQDCTGLKELNMSNFDLSNVETDKADIFTSMYATGAKFNLLTIHTPKVNSLEIELPGRFQENLNSYAPSTTMPTTTGSSKTIRKVGVANYHANFTSNIYETPYMSDVVYWWGTALGELPEISREGYTFKGWNTTRDGTGITLTSDTILDASLSNYYAQWEANKYTVTFDDNGGSGGPGSELIPYGERYYFYYAPFPTRPGYNFKNWYTQPEGGDPIGTTTTLSTAEDHTLYAHWTEVPGDPYPVFRKMASNGNFVVKQNGTEVPDRGDAISGRIVTITATPASTSYVVDYVSVELWENDAPTGKYVTVTGPDANGDYSFIMPETKVVVSVGFKIPVKGVSLDKSEISVAKDSSQKLTAYIYPSSATNKTVKWTSSDESVATVDRTGNVTGVSKGTAVITATTSDGKFTATCTVKVTQPHIHCWCGSTTCGTEDGHNQNQLWTEWDGTGNPAGTQYYYLNNPQTRTAKWNISNSAKAHVCLNGQTWDFGTYGISVSSSSSLTLTDCSNTVTPGYISDNVWTAGTHATKPAVELVGGRIASKYSNNTESSFLANDGTVNICGGNIVCTTSAKGIDNKSSTSVLNFYNGKLIARYFETGTNQNARAISNTNSSAKANLYGGSILNAGAGVYNNGTLNLEGTEISGCYWGVNNNGSVKLNGSDVSGNKNRDIYTNKHIVIGENIAQPTVATKVQVGGITVFTSGWSNSMGNQAGDYNNYFAVYNGNTSLKIGIDADGELVAGSAYSVSYNKNGGTGNAPQQANIVANSVFAIPGDNGLTKENFVFAGWNDGTTTYKAGDTYTMPAKSVTFTAQWASKACILSFEDAQNGTFTVTVDGAPVATGTSVDADKTVTVTPVPADGYEVDTVKYNGIDAAKGENGAYTFTMPAEDTTLVVTFKVAATRYPIWVGTEQFTSEKLTINGSSGTAILTVGGTVDAPIYTLTLNNFSYTGDGYNFGEDTNCAAVYADDTDLKIVLNGTNSLICTKDYAIRVYGGNDLYILGDGAADKLTVESTNQCMQAHNIKIEKAAVTTGNLLASGNFDIIESTVTVVDHTQDEGCNIWAWENLSVSSSTINLNTEKGHLSADEKLTIKDNSTIETADGKYGFIDSQVIEIDNSNVTVAGDVTAAILVSSKLAILNGSTVKSTVAGKDEQLPALASAVIAIPTEVDGNCDIVIDDSELEANGAYCGILTFNSVTIKGNSTVTATGNEMSVGQINMESDSLEALAPTFTGTFAAFAGNDAQSAAVADASASATYEKKYVKLVSASFDATLYKLDGTKVDDIDIAVENGSYVYTLPENLPVGVYQLVITTTVDGESTTVTKAVQITGEEISNEVSIPSDTAIGSKSSVVNNSAAGDYAAIVGGLDKVANSSVETDPVTISLVVTEIEENDSVSQDVKDEIDAIKELDSAKTFEFVDFTLNKKVGSNTDTDIGDSNSELIKITINFTTEGRKNITAYRYHGTSPEALSPVADNNTTDEGFYVGNGYVTIFAKKFSTYAIGYEEVQSGGGNTNSGSSYDNDTDYEIDFWHQVADTIENAKDGDTIKVNARDYDKMPASVMRALAENSGVNIEIKWNGGETIVIPAGKALNDPGRIYYPLGYLEKYDFGEIDWSKLNPETGGFLEITAPVIPDFVSAPKLPSIAQADIEKDLPVVADSEINVADQRAELNLSWIWMLLAVVILGEGYLYYDKRKSFDA